MNDGRFVIADGGVYYGGQAPPQYALLVYDSIGHFIAKFGGPGQGPGEFGSLDWAGVYRTDSIAAYDRDDHTLEIFTSDGKFARSLSLSRNMPATRPPREAMMQPGSVLGIFADGRVLQKGFGLIPSGPEGPTFWENSVFVDSPEGVSIDTVSHLRFGYQLWRGGKYPEGILYGLRPAAIVGPNEWYYGTGEEFAIDVFDASGSKTREVRRNIQPAAVTEADKNRYADWQLSMPTAMIEGARDRKAAIKKMAEDTRRNGRFAERMPAYSTIMIDSDQNLWVEHYRFHADIGDWPKEAARWSVFDRVGKFLGEVRTPVGVDVKGITDSYVIGIWKDDLDVVHVSAYTINKPRGM
jgi:hypothetical protein